MSALLAGVWRAVSQHGPIEEAAPVIYQLLQEAAPQLRGILLRRWDGERLHLETVALAARCTARWCPAVPPPPPVGMNFSPGPPRNGRKVGTIGSSPRYRDSWCPMVSTAR